VLESEQNNIKLTVAYDGNNYVGWQKTRWGQSIEETLEKALTQILQHPICLQAASRTDAGVHANGQVVNFFTPRKDLCLKKLIIGLCALLPKDIAVLNAELAPFDFHPTLHSVKKEYHYYVCNGTTQLPQHRYFSWHYPPLLNISAMREGASLLIGEHDFSAFCNFKKNHKYKHFIRHLLEITIVELPDQRIRFEVIGNHFLYKMVRNLIGTLVYVGCQKIEVSAILNILKSGDRTQGGVTAPAHGLFLEKIYYPRSGNPCPKLKGTIAT
jgi:tRNA pseudouridine38-40 synthase